MLVGVYINSPKGKRHITTWPEERTLCGLRIGDEWTLDDETVSGGAATCSRCRWAFLAKQG